MSSRTPCTSIAANSDSPQKTYVEIITQQRAWGHLTSQRGRCSSTRSRTEWRTESRHCSSCPAPDPSWPSAKRDSAPRTLRLTCWSWGKALSTGTMLRSVLVHRWRTFILMLFHLLYVKDLKIYLRRLCRSASDHDQFTVESDIGHVLKKIKLAAEQKQRYLSC